jgi:hypothetical protein
MLLLMTLLLSRGVHLAYIFLENEYLQARKLFRRPWSFATIINT